MTLFKIFPLVGGFLGLYLFCSNSVFAEQKRIEVRKVNSIEEIKKYSTIYTGVLELNPYLVRPLAFQYERGVDCSAYTILPEAENNLERYKYKKPWEVVPDIKVIVGCSAPTRIVVSNRYFKPDGVSFQCNGLYNCVYSGENTGDAIELKTTTKEAIEEFIKN